MKTHALIFSAVLLTAPAFAQAIDSPRPSASADVPARAILIQQKDIRLAPRQEIVFQSIGVPSDPDVICRYQFTLNTATTDRFIIVELDRASGAVTATAFRGGSLTPGGCGAPANQPVQPGIIDFEVARDSRVTFETTAQSAGLPGVTLFQKHPSLLYFTNAETGDTSGHRILGSNIAPETYVELVDFATEVTSYDSAGYVELFAAVDITSEASTSTGYVTLGSVVLTLNYE
jgi:hypothetical protein